MSLGNRLSFMQSYAGPGPDVAAITGITEANLAGFRAIECKVDRENVDFYVGYWDGGSAGTAFVPATFDAFPVGSIVHDVLGQKLYYHISASAWKYGAIAT
jgi:hypothetical protein